ncbi:MAG: GtrA family protein [Pseudomonadota bacterium]
MSKRHPDGLLQRALRFGLVGLMNTGIGLAAILAVQELTPAGPYLANGIGYGVGLVVSFLLNRRWTFAADGPALPQALRFALTFAVCYGLNLATLGGLLALGAPAVLAQIGAMAVYTGAFFVASQVFVFR